MAIAITQQPQNTLVVKGHIAGKLSVEATGVTSYQWKKAKSASSVAGATVVSNATAATFTIPTDLTEDAYYFCTLTGDGDSAETVNTSIATVSVVDDVPYITGAYVNAYIAGCAKVVQTRFAEAKALSGIEIPDDNKVLRTAQVELFMSVL